MSRRFWRSPSILPLCDENISWYAVGKLCVNGRIHFSGVEKKGPRHCEWAHILVNELYEDGGSLAKLLKM